MSYFKRIFSPLIVDNATVSGPLITINYLTVRAVIITIRLCLDTDTGWAIRCFVCFVLGNPLKQGPAKLSDIMRALYWGIPWNRDRPSYQILCVLCTGEFLDTETGWAIRYYMCFVLGNPLTQRPAKLSDTRITLLFLSFYLKAVLRKSLTPQHFVL